MAILQSGRFGKLNKRVTFPETLDLSPYMSDGGDRTDVYKLYAVVVHVDMLNASFFGHYICYVKDFRGHWYRVDDCKVEILNLCLSLAYTFIFIIIFFYILNSCTRKSMCVKASVRLYGLCLDQNWCTF